MKQKSALKYKELDDQFLLKQYLENADQKAFGTLLARHEQKVYSYIYSMVGNTEVANDLFQETFTKIIDKLESAYTDQGKFIAWAMRIAHNATIDYIRKRKRIVDIRERGEDDFDTDYFERVADVDTPDAVETLEFEEAKAALFKHIQQLPPEQKEVLVLRHYYEMSFKEIAELSDVSINTALGRMRYALINLRKAFEKENGKNVKQKS